MEIKYCKNKIGLMLMTAITVAILLPILFLATSAHAATSIELTTGNFINVFGNLNLSGNNLVNAGNVSIRGNLSVDGNVSVDGTTFFVDATSNNVGIGTTGPDGKLHVAGIADGASVFFDSSTLMNTAGNDLSMTFRSSDETEVAKVQSIVESNGNIGMALHTYSTTLGERVRITSAGSVGIGTTSPAGKLNVVGSGQTDIVFNDTTSNVRQFFNFATGGVGQIFFQEAGTDRGIIEFRTDTTPDKMEFYVGGSDAASNRMVIDANGNVGIGTTSPATLLQLAASAPELRLNASTAGGYIGLKTNSVANTDLDIQQNGTSRVYINPSGNVGIGTTGPGAKLDVGGLTDGGINFLGTSVKIGNKPDLTNPRIYRTPTVGGLTFDVDGNEDDLVITSAGNVGIGTTSPKSTLSIKERTGAEAAINFTDTDDTYLGVIGVASATNSLLSGSGNTDFIINAIDAAGDLLFGTSNTERMRITPTGNVGIGTTSPGQKLVVVGGVNITGGLNVSDGGLNVISGNVGIGTNVPSQRLDIIPTTGERFVVFDSSSSRGGGAAIGAVGKTTSTNFDVLAYAAGSHRFYTGSTITTDTEKVRIDSAGNVGIGTTTPTERLVVIGNLSINNSAGTSNILIDTTNKAILFKGENGSLYQPVYGSDDDLVLYLPFNGPNGSVQFDRSPFGNDGLQQNATNCNATLGKYGAACEFDEKSHIALGNSSRYKFNVSEPFTVEAWINFKGGSSDDSIIVGNGHDINPDGWHIRVRDTNRIRFMILGTLNKISDSSVFSNNTWYHVVGTYNGDGAASSQGLKVYVNGVLDTTYNTDDALGTVSIDSPLTIGAVTVASGAITSFFNGTIDELKIYKRALAPEEIRTQYLRGKGFGASGAITADKFRVVNTSASKIFEINQTGATIAPGGVQRLTIDSSGNVGIGTTSPRATLNVVGDVYHNLSTPSQHFNIVNATGDSRFFINNTGAGRVGIGRVPTTTSALEIQLGLGGDVRPLGVNIYRASGTVSHHIGMDSNQQASFSMSNIAGTTVIQFVSDPVTSTDNSYINNGGNLGIGTTAPTAKLHINGSGGALLNISNATTAMLYVDGTSGRVGIGTASPQTKMHLLNSGSGGDPATSGTTDPAMLLRLDANDGTAFDFGTSNLHDGVGWIQVRDEADFSANRRLLLNPNGGNVGIGTASPSQVLEISGSTNEDGNFAGLRIVGSTAPIIYLNSTNANSATRNWVITTNEQTFGDFDIRQSNSIGGSPIGSTGTSRFYIGAAGNVGIGTTAAPSARLVVMGNLSVNNTDGTSRLFVDTSTGNVGIGTAGPDARLDIQLPGSGDVRVKRLSGTNAYRLATDSNQQAQFLISNIAGATVIQLASDSVTSGDYTYFNSGNVGIGNTQPNVTLGVSGNLNVSGRISYGTLSANSPHFLETMGAPEPLCIKSAIGKYVGCMADENFEFECKIDDRCSRKFLDAKLSEEIEKLSKQIEQKEQKSASTQPAQQTEQTASQTQTTATTSNQSISTENSLNQTQSTQETLQNTTQNSSSLVISGGQTTSNIGELTQPNSAANATASASNSITGNAINELGLETDLTSILEPETTASNATTSTTTSTTTDTSSPNAEIDNNNNSTNETISNTTNNATSATETQEEQDIDAQKSIIKAKIERLSRIKKEVKEKSITVKSAIEKLKAEQLKDVDLSEIESEEDAAYKAIKKSKEAPAAAQVAQLDYITKVNGSIILRLG